MLQLLTWTYVIHHLTSTSTTVPVQLRTEAQHEAGSGLGHPALRACFTTDDRRPVQGG